MGETLLALADLFAKLSLLPFGSINAILPEMQRQVVDVQQWMSPQEFSTLFALAHAAPGPNMMIATLIGWHVGGYAGMFVTTMATFGPSSIVVMIALRVWERFEHHAWRNIMQRALLPVTAGVVTASALRISEASNHSLMPWIITGVVASAALRATTHPLWLLGAGALVGLTGLGQ